MLTLCLTLLLATGLSSQTYTVLDADMQPTKNTRKARYLLAVEKENDTTWVKMFYDFTGPARSIETYRDKNLTVRHGRCVYYRRNGIPDSICSYKDGLLHGPLAVVDAKGERKIFRKYAYGKLLPEEEVGEEIDSSLYKKRRFSEGSEGWRLFLTKNIRYPSEAVDHDLQGSVRVQFNVDEAGRMSESFVFRSVAFWLDREALRLVRRSGNWEPGEYDGEKVKTYFLQPITFRLASKKAPKPRN